MALSEDDLHALYLWIDEIPLSKQKRNIARDFSDGVCVAEVVRHYFPKYVEIHNFVPTSNSEQKHANWNTLNAKVFKKLNFSVPPAEVDAIIRAVPGAVERFLAALQTKIVQIRQKAASSEHGATAGSMSASGRDSHNPHGVAGAGGAAGGEFTHQPAVVGGGGGCRGGSSGGHPMQSAETHDQRDMTVAEMQRSVKILQSQVQKLNQLVAVRDEKIRKLEDENTRLRQQFR